MSVSVSKEKRKRTFLTCSGPNDRKPAMPMPALPVPCTGPIAISPSTFNHIVHAEDLTPNSDPNKQNASTTIRKIRTTNGSGDTSEPKEMAERATSFFLNLSKTTAKSKSSLLCLRTCSLSTMCSAARHPGNEDFVRRPFPSRQLLSCPAQESAPSTDEGSSVWDPTTPCFLT